MDKIPEGFYLNNLTLKTIDKCPDRSKQCSNKSLEIDSCISCNEGYYPKLDELDVKFNNDSFINCYKDPEGFYLEDNIYKPCYLNYQECNEYGEI